MCYNSDLANLQPKLYSFVKDRVRNPSDAEDVVQNVNQVLINKKDDYDPSLAFSNWAFGVAKWQVLAYYKKSKRAVPLLSLDISEGLNPDWLNDVPFSNLIRKERHQLIKGLTHILSKRQKQIFNLLLQDFTNDEMAKALGVSSKNIQSTKCKLIQRIKKFVTNNKDEKYHNY
tara:strand:- start:2351 stop:2869 length:519 start_codon:yes stop_codon:yes gene_type:complete